MARLGMLALCLALACAGALRPLRMSAQSNAQPPAKDQLREFKSVFRAQTEDEKEKKLERTAITTAAASNARRKSDGQYWLMEQMSQMPLLKASEEKILGGRIQRMQELKLLRDELLGKEPSRQGRAPKGYGESHRRAPPSEDPEDSEDALSREEWAAAAGISVAELDEAIGSGVVAKQELVSRNMRLVVAVARRYQNLGVGLPDLIQEGSFGLIKAAERYDPWRGFRFSTYASWWIQQTVTRAVAAQSRLIRLPMHVHNLLNKVRRLSRQLSEKTGLEPTEEQLAAELDMPPSRLRTVLRASAAAQVVTMEAPFAQRVSSAGGAEDLPAPEETFGERRKMQQVMKLLRDLGDTEAKCVALRYGLLDGHSRTPQQIATGLGVERRVVSSSLSRALRKLRQPQTIQEIASIVSGSQSPVAREVPSEEQQRTFDPEKDRAAAELWRSTSSGTVITTRRKRRKAKAPGPPEGEGAIGAEALPANCDIPKDIKARELGIKPEDWDIVEGIDALAALSAEDAFLDALREEEGQKVGTEAPC